MRSPVSIEILYVAEVETSLILEAYLIMTFSIHLGEFQVSLVDCFLIHFLQEWTHYSHLLQLSSDVLGHEY